RSVCDTLPRTVACSKRSSNINRKFKAHGMLPTLVIGDFRRKEYAGPARWRMRHGAETAANVEAALERIDGGCTPAVILVLQERPGSVADRQIAMLRRKAPLARIGVLLGSWSEGETRTGQPL